MVYDKLSLFSRLGSSFCLSSFGYSKEFCQLRSQGLFLFKKFERPWEMQLRMKCAGRCTLQTCRQLFPKI